MPARSWNVTDADRALHQPCTAYAGGGADLFLRALDVSAEPATVFRWLCQLRVAPYSYDLLDNLGRRSPRTLTPGLEDLAVGQRFAGVARIVEFERDRQITAVTAGGGGRLLGRVALTYTVRPAPTGTRLVAGLAVGANGPVQRVVRELLGWGDLVMMRKQLRTLRDLAEHVPG